MALPDVGTIVAQANQPTGLDVALKQSPTTPGRLTFDWSGPGGDLLFDDSASYPVLSTVVARKGRCRADRRFGTRLYTILKDRRSTGDQLRAAGRDGGDQVEAAQIADRVTPRPERVGALQWRLNLGWLAAGRSQGKSVVF